MEEQEWVNIPCIPYPNGMNGMNPGMGGSMYPNGMGMNGAYSGTMGYNSMYPTKGRNGYNTGTMGYNSMYPTGMPGMNPGMMARNTMNPNGMGMNGMQMMGVTMVVREATCMATGKKFRIS